MSIVNTLDFNTLIIQLQKINTLDITLDSIEYCIHCIDFL
jgi:hypothetical protein